jgi:aldehyde dehydrogenase (NAD+)
VGRCINGETFDNVNPADTNDIVGKFPLSTAEDVNRAVASAKARLRDMARERRPRCAATLCARPVTCWLLARKKSRR